MSNSGVAQSPSIPHVQSLLAAIVESSDDAIVSKSLEGVISSWNSGAARLFGYAPEEAIGRHISFIIPKDRLSEETHILTKIRAGERVDHYETIRQTKDGRLIEISLTVSPIRDASGTVVGASKVARDITERRATEAELRRYRDDLQAMVAERSAALEESTRQLRAAERALALGTLAAGFGHDMSNLLLPIFVRLDAIELAPISPEIRDDVAAIRAAARYLQRLSSGLRLMALDPADEIGESRTDLGAWWEDVDGIFLGVLPRTIDLVESGLRGSDLSVAMPRHRLTQAIFNLIQNAAEATAGLASGAVRIAAGAHPDPEGRAGVRLVVEDTGPGMDSETRQRCFEPYFSTKGRTLTKGMGLSLVRALIRGAGGAIDVESSPGHGALFVIWLPCPPARGAPVERERALHAATVSLAYAPRAAFAAAILEATGFRAAIAPSPSDRDALWVTDSADEEGARRFLAGDGRMVMVSPQPPAWAAGVSRLRTTPPSARDVREALAAASAECAALVGSPA
jgi:PAS domain S-box-containing protein